MAFSTRHHFTRMLGARQRLIDVRAQRMEQLQRLRGYFRDALTEFVANCDPVSGQRFVDVTADGNKARGEMSVGVTFFEGTHLTIAVDAMARFSHSSNPDGVFGEIGKIVDLHVSADLTRATLLFDSAGPHPVRRTIDIADALEALVVAAVESVEGDLGDLSEPEPVAATERDHDAGVVRNGVSLRLH